MFDGDTEAVFWIERIELDVVALSIIDSKNEYS